MGDAREAVGDKRRRYESSGTWATNIEPRTAVAGKARGYESLKLLLMAESCF